MSDQTTPNTPESKTTPEFKPAATTAPTTPSKEVKKYDPKAHYSKGITVTPVPEEEPSNANMAAWLFLPQGLLMPAIIPDPTKGEGEADPKLTDNGRRQIQVRSRVESHLTNFIRDYMRPMGLDFSDIQHTPNMDYNVRFYTTHEDFAKAVMQAMLDINALKFKPLAEQKDANNKPIFKDGAPWHSLLNGVWGSITRLAPAGGSWAPYSPTNPTGYKSQKVGYGGTTVGQRGYGSRSYRHEDGRGYVPTSFGDLDALTDEELAEIFDAPDTSDDYTPAREERIERILRKVEGIPAEQWDDWLEPDEQDLVKEIMDAELESRRGLPMYQEREERPLSRRERREARRAAKRVRTR